MSQTTKGIIEAEIANAVTKFHREQQGRGPSEVRAKIVGDLVVVRCLGILTSTEGRLSGTEDGRKLIRSARQELRAINHVEIEETISQIAGSAVLRSYSDMSVEAEELFEIYVLERNIESKSAQTTANAPGPIHRSF